MHLEARAYLYFVPLLVSDERTHFSANYFYLVSSTVNQLTTETSSNQTAPSTDRLSYTSQICLAHVSR